MPSTHLPPRPPFPTSTPDPSIIPRFAATPLPRSSETTTTSGATPVATAEPDIFISLRFNEARPAGNALQAALEAKNMSVFLCDVAPGENLASAVVNALTHCKLAVILGTKTYGQKTSSPFSTCEELQYIVDERKPYFLVKMCEAFEEAHARFNLPSTISYYPWRPTVSSLGTVDSVPDALVSQIADRLHTVVHGPRRRAGSAAATAATVTARAAAAAAPQVPASHSGGARAAAAAVPQVPASHGGGAGAAAAVAPQVPASHSGGARAAEQVVHGSGGGGSRRDVNGAAGTIHSDLSAWLASVKLADAESVLRDLGAEDAHDVKAGFEEGVISQEELVARGMKPLRAIRLKRKAEEVCRGGGGEKAELGGAAMADRQCLAILLIRASFLALFIFHFRFHESVGSCCTCALETKLTLSRPMSTPAFCCESDFSRVFDRNY